MFQWHILKNKPKSAILVPSVSISGPIFECTPEIPVSCMTLTDCLACRCNMSQRERERERERERVMLMALLMLIAGG
jgi:hypothetical protein